LILTFLVCIKNDQFYKIDRLFPIFETINQNQPTLTMSAFTEKECCICYEQIGQTNNCVTGCGHAFCFKCLALAMAHKNSCPCCRAKLIDVPDEEEDDDADSDYEESVNEEEDDDIDDEGHVEDIVDRLEKEGITMIDVVSMLLNRYSKRDTKYTVEHIQHINNRFDQLAAEVDTEFIEQQRFAAEDTRSIQRATVQDVRDIEKVAIEALNGLSAGI
jgi:Ring finger domain